MCECGIRILARDSIEHTGRSHARVGPEQISQPEPSGPVCHSTGPFLFPTLNLAAIEPPIRTGSCLSEGVHLQLAAHESGHSSVVELWPSKPRASVRSRLSAPHVSDETHKGCALASPSMSCAANPAGRDVPMSMASVQRGNSPGRGSMP